MKLKFLLPLLILSGQLMSQCSYTGGEANLAVTPTCSNQTTTGVDGLGSGAYKYFTGFLPGTWYYLQLDNNGGNTTCAGSSFTDATPTVLSAWDNNLFAGTYDLAPANTAYLLVETGGTWNTSSSYLTYAIATPTDPTWSGGSSTACQGNTLVYAVNASSYATEYVWTVGSGAYINGTPGQTTLTTSSSSISVTFPSISTSAVTVYASNNGYCNSTTITYPYTVYNSVIPLTQPVGTTVCAGGSANLSFTTSNGSSLNFQWQYFDGTSWANVTDGTPVGVSYLGGATNNLTVFTGAGAAAGSYQYQCTLSSPCTNLNSDPATIVISPINITSFTITTPAPVTCAGGAANISFSTNDAAAAIQWQYDNAGNWTGVADGTPTEVTYAGDGTTSLDVNTGLATPGGTYAYQAVLSDSANTCATGPIHFQVASTTYTTINQTICDGQSYYVYTSAGTYIDTFSSSSTGCDSVRTLKLAVLQPVSDTVTTSICAGQTYYGYSTSGTYVDTLLSSGGCDSVRTLNLTVLDPIYDTIAQTICAGDNYYGYTASGTYTDLFTSSQGCDSNRTLNLLVLDPVFDTIAQTICQGQTYFGYDTSGTYTDTLQSSAGCDSIRTLNLTVLAPVFTTDSQTICANEFYSGHDTTGTYIDTLQSSAGCDSIRTLQLTVLPVVTGTDVQTICQGTSYFGYDTSGTYIDTLTGVNGCDSVRTLQLTVTPWVTSTDSQTLCQGETYAGYNASGTFVDTLTGVNGCDSIRTLVLNVLPVANTNDVQTICQGQSYAGYTSSGTFIDTFTAVNGCDSIRTLNLTVNPVPTTSVSTTLCPGQSYNGHTTTGTYSDTLQTVNGCDSIVNVQLTISNPITTTDNQTICLGGSYGGHSTAGTFVDTFTAVSGCDSVRTLTLSVIRPVTSSLNQTICLGQSYNGHSSTGVFVDTFTAAASNGCDSILTLNLTVLNPVTSTVSQTICQGGSYGGHSTAGTFVDTLTAASGCDSIRTLTLTVNTGTSSTISKTICPGDTFMGHTTSGTFNDTLVGHNGCDSVVTVHLTVDVTPTPVISQSGDTLSASPAAAGYKWYLAGNPVGGGSGQTFVAKSPGAYTVVETDSAGCKSQSAVHTVLGIGEVSNSLGMVVFPNPASTSVNIQLNGLTDNGKISIHIYDAIGRLVYEHAELPTGNNYQVNINTSNMQQGMYLVQVEQSGFAAKQSLVITR